MAKVVFLLCGFTSLLCAVLLLRGYARHAVRLLLWSGICFSLFSLSNFLLVIDRFVMTSTDLTLFHNALTLLGLAVLLYGLIWDS